MEKAENIFELFKHPYFRKYPETIRSGDDSSAYHCEPVDAAKNLALDFFKENIDWVKR